MGQHWGWAQGQAIDPNPKTDPNQEAYRKQSTEEGIRGLSLRKRPTRDQVMPQPLYSCISPAGMQACLSAPFPCVLRLVQQPEGAGSWNIGGDSGVLPGMLTFSMDPFTLSPYSSPVALGAAHKLYPPSLSTLFLNPQETEQDKTSAASHPEQPFQSLRSPASFPSLYHCLRSSPHLPREKVDR